MLSFRNRHSGVVLKMVWWIDRHKTLAQYPGMTREPQAQFEPHCVGRDLIRVRLSVPKANQIFTCSFDMCSIEMYCRSYSLFRPPAIWYKRL